VIGGGAGVIGGIIAGALIGAAIGSASIVLCLLALLVALIVAAAAVLVGALIGGQIGKAAADSSQPTASGGQVLLVGDYVSTSGGLVTLGDAEEAQVYGSSQKRPPWPLERSASVQPRRPRHESHSRCLPGDHHLIGSHQRLRP
jgi:hypothetical protein